MNRLLWIDLEMTGLDVEKERIIEAAAIVTDLQFQPLEEYHRIVKQPQEFLDRMDEWNTNTHGKSGLTAKVPNGTPPDVVEEELMELVKRHWAQGAVLAGNSIGQDRLFINKYWPRLNELLHYRMLDVTSWKVIFKEKFKLEHVKQDKHRALDDIKESIDELKYYLSFVRTK